MVLWIPPCLLEFRLQDFHLLWWAFPKPFCYPLRINCAVRTPECSHSGLGSFHFARRYFGNHGCFLFLRLLRCFSSPGSPHTVMDSLYADGGLLRRVSPFRNFRIVGYLLLPETFRSLSRLSSALSAKASTIRSYQHNQLMPSAGTDFIYTCIALHALASGLFFSWFSSSDSFESLHVFT